MVNKRQDSEMEDFEEEYGWSPDSDYEILKVWQGGNVIGEENIGGESRNMKENK